VAGKLLGEWSWREAARRAGAYCAGVGVLLVALLAWALIDHVPLGSIWYAMFGFRLDAVSALTGPGAGARLAGLGSPFLASGLAVAVAFAVIGILRLKARPLVRITFAAWMIAATAGILLGGSYWPHYLIALVPGAAAGAAAVFQRNRLIGALALCAILVPTALNAANVARRDSADSFQLSAVTIGNYIKKRALPTQTAYVLYAKVNTLYYAGLRDPFPYNWALMMTSAPHAEARLHSLLESPARPTWIVKADLPSSFRLDKSHVTKRLLAQHYRVLDKVCGTRILLAKGAQVLPAPHGSGCGAPSSGA
jgi:hypothetical protein